MSLSLTFLLFFLLLVIALAFPVLQNRKLKKRIRELIKDISKQRLSVEEEKNELVKKVKKISLENLKSEEILNSILPDNTINELKTKGRTVPRQFKKVSIMFADFKGFTKIAEKTSPQDLISLLDNYFTKYDDIVQQYNVEKIKTIGDAYMCAGGLPIRNKSNPIDVTLAALAIQRVTEKINNPDWRLRIGIHTGEVIAGVVGLRRYSYDIWGDSVNIASRVEAASDIGKVNISESTYELIKEFFDCSYRGKVKAKNKGYIDMYFVLGVKKELSVDGKGVFPNNLFNKYVDLHLYSAIKYRKAEKHIIKMLESMLPDNLYYHDIRHTKDVCAAVERLGLMEGIEGDDLFLLKTAALFHDAGFTEEYKDNEPLGAKLAAETLPEFGYTEKQIQKIKKLILATRITVPPKNHLEEIICDADLDYLGREEFPVIANRLKKEFKERDVISSNKSWDELQVKFFEKHRYYTKSAKELRTQVKDNHLREIKRRLKDGSNYRD